LKQIIMVRHGQGTNNLPNSVIGSWSNVELTELGVKQAGAVAERLSNELKGNFAVYASDLRRAKHTAEIICEKLDVTPNYALELREHNAGLASGMDRDEAMKLYIKMDPPTLDWRPWSDAESWGEFYHRVASFMDILSEKEERVLIVSHGGTIQNIIRWWLGTPLSDFFEYGFGVANTSVTVLDYNQYGVKRIERLNDTTHYALIGSSNPIK
jgi:broad specificity phosphatase PhoE